jgi:hypothetical protein
LDGTDDAVSIDDSNSLNITQNITLSAWVKTSVNPYNNPIIVKDIEGAKVPYRLQSGNGSISGISFYDGSWHATGALNLGDSKWHHVAGTYNGTTLVAYVDGKQNATLVYTASLPTNNAKLYIGRYASTWFNGSIDEAMIFNRALKPWEIQQLYEQGNKRYGYFNELDVRVIQLYKDINISFDGNYLRFNYGTNAATDFAYFSGNVSALGYYTRTSVYDKSQGIVSFMDMQLMKLLIILDLKLRNILVKMDKEILIHAQEQFIHTQK